MKKSIILIIAILVCVVSSAWAAEYDAVAVDIADSLDMTIRGMDISGEKIDVLFKYYPNVDAADPSGIYWRFMSATPAYQGVPVQRDTYQYSPEEPADRHMLDIYYAEHPEMNKVIIFVPGGAWRQGDKDLYVNLGTTLAGFYPFTVVVINYRLSSDSGGNAVHPDHINDVAAAFAWVKKNISPYGDGSSLYLFGQSAGAHLVSLLATDGRYLQNAGCSVADIKGVISMSGTYDLPDLVQYPDNSLDLEEQDVLMYKKIMRDAFGGWSDETLTDPSPTTHINASQPSFLVAYTYNDLPGFPREAEDFVRAVRGLSPAPEISLRKIEFSDYSDTVWQAAVDMAAQEPAMSGYAGHYAEVMPINPQEPDSYVTRLVADFVRSH